MVLALAVPCPATAQVKTTMTAEQYRAALVRLAMDQGEAAAFLGVTVRTSHGYANGQPIPRSVELALQMMLLLREAIEQDVGANWRRRAKKVTAR